MPEKIVKNNCSETYISDMARYSIVTNLRRSIPDIKDGLKPVQRRILFAMDYDEHAHGSKTVKSISAVGTILKKYHPHSDSSVYDAMKPISNWFECKIPLLIPGGSFGNIAGDKASASRYTFTKLSPFTVDCVIARLHESKAMTDWNPNFDDTAKEPEYLPAKVPLLLINGASGTGVGVSVDIPTHNLSEVLQATIKLIDNPKSDVILVPDHCIDCDIIDTDWKAISKKGHGKYRARGHIDIAVGKVVEAKQNGSRRKAPKLIESNDGNPILVIKSLPVYGSNKIVNQIDDLVASGKFPQIIDVSDASTTDTGINIFIKLRKGADAEYVKSVIYKYTDCEKSFTINFEIVDGVYLRHIGYKEYLNKFIEFSILNKFREYYSALAEINTRLHKLDAFIKVLKSGYIDKFINMLKKKKGTDDNYLIEFLIKNAKVTDLQAQFIINATIKQLSLDTLTRYEAETKDLTKKMNELESFVVDEKLIRKAVRADLVEILKKYGTPRICNVIKASDTGNIPQGTFKLVVTENNFIRKLGLNEPINSIRGDKPKFSLDVENTESVLLFDNKGRVYNLPVHKIPLVSKSDPGVDIKLIIRGLTADIVAVSYEPWIKNLATKKGKFFIAVLTEGNTIKKLNIEDFLNVPPSGIIYSKVNQNDKVISVVVISDSLDVVIYSNKKALRIHAKDIPWYKRNTIGVIAMNTKEPLVGMTIIYPDSTDIVVITESGKINRFPASGLEVSVRNKAGSSVIKLGRGDRVFSILGGNKKSTVSITSTNGTINIPVKDIATGSSISSGVKTFNSNEILLTATII